MDDRKKRGDAASDGDAGGAAEPLEGSGEAIPLPIDGILDLHTFDPAEVRDLVPDYLAECRARGILMVRIIHGKGTGALRATVHSILGKTPGVISFTQAGEEEGGWGATIVRLEPPPLA